jgi:hypothetical protein
MLVVFQVSRYDLVDRLAVKDGTKIGAILTRIEVIRQSFSL